LKQAFCLPETKGQTMHDISSKFHSKPQLRQQQEFTSDTTELTLLNKQEEKEEMKAEPYSK
jgi:hypothetical protein